MKILFNIEQQKNSLISFIKSCSLIFYMFCFKTFFKVHITLFCLLVFSMMFSCHQALDDKYDEDILNMTNNNQDSSKHTTMTLEPDKSTLEPDKSTLEPVQVAVDPVTQKATAITDDLISFYNIEKKSGKGCTLALLPRDTVISLMKKGIESGAIPMDTSSQKIINILRNRYGYFITAGADNYSNVQQIIIIAAYTKAFLDAKMAGKL